jgi:hypothetical protein
VRQEVATSPAMNGKLPTEPESTPGAKIRNR